MQDRRASRTPNGVRPYTESRARDFNLLDSVGKRVRTTERSGKGSGPFALLQKNTCQAQFLLATKRHAGNNQGNNQGRNNQGRTTFSGLPGHPVTLSITSLSAV